MFGIRVAKKSASRKVCIKSWNDVGNKEGVRPKSVLIHLLVDGEDTGKTLELSEANQWSVSFENLDVKKSGTAIFYTVSEDPVFGYTGQIYGSQEMGFIVTNTHSSADNLFAVYK